MTALSVRQFLHDLFGSRLNQRLEGDLIQLRNDFESRLQDKDEVIASLRVDIAALQAKIIIYENTILPHVSRIGADVVQYNKPKLQPLKPSWSFAEPPLKSSWQQEVERNDRLIAEELAKEKAAGESHGQ